ncbi:hypothetical protein SAMN05446037_103650 [Anaerovirgula multivorans]|uniref:Uncharacterized protein n=1 Tax=Anaerovirgula multivorans TaxID=312168 RepID=A0A239JNX5_9FIRM|nr:hypothetical protein SAMN05446037_103650 [Anaerovirgula multivorans]
MCGCLISKMFRKLPTKDAYELKQSHTLSYDNMNDKKSQYIVSRGNISMIIK